VSNRRQFSSPRRAWRSSKKNGVTHVVTVPDSETNYLYELMRLQPWLEIIPAAREGETFAISFGLFVGGKVPVCVIQNTGMLESGDSIKISASAGTMKSSPQVSEDVTRNGSPMMEPINS
jgi:sulfopyruvate decarboxylase TPP-binding subunit